MQPSLAAAGPAARIIGRYALYGEIAAGGMATVHYGRLVGAVGFSRTVAIKRLHPQFAKDPEFVTMFLDEARLAARIQHPNVVATIDVVPLDDEVFLVMEYIHGEALSKLIRVTRRSGQLLPPPIATAIVAGALHGLHAAHEAKSERGQPLQIVHRDVSPQNILVGVDGVPRVLDFGVAKAAMRAQSTRDGQMKGKVSYMAPEQLRGKGVDRRTDVFAAGIVLWEALTGRRLFDGDDPGEVLTKLLEVEIPAPSAIEPSVPAALDPIVLKALSRDVDRRWSTAREFAIALERSGGIALSREVGEWVEATAVETITRRSVQVAEIESLSSSGLRTVGEPASPASPGAAAAGLQAPGTSQPAPLSGPLGAPPGRGEPTTSPSQVSHVTGVSSPSQLSSPSQASVASQVTGLSAAHSFAPPRRGLFAALIGVAAALGIALLVLVVVLVGRRRVVQDSDVVGQAAPPQPTAALTEPPTVKAAPPEPEPVPVPVASATTEAKKEAPPKKPAIKAAGASPLPKPPAAKPPAAKPPADSCDPPFTIDKNGVRRIKPGCG